MRLGTGLWLGSSSLIAIAAGSMNFSHPSQSGLLVLLMEDF